MTWLFNTFQLPSRWRQFWFCCKIHCIEHPVNVLVWSCFGHHQLQFCVVVEGVVCTISFVRLQEQLQEISIGKNSSRKRQSRIDKGVCHLMAGFQSKIITVIKIDWLVVGWHKLNILLFSKIWLWFTIIVITIENGTFSASQLAR